MVIALLNSKGGVGKSTLAIHLARAFQLQGYSVVIVDSDRQGTARDWGEVQADDSTYPNVVAIDRPTLEKNVPPLTKAFDFVVIDGAAKLEDMYVSAIKVADIVLIPVQPSPADIWAVGELVDLLKVRQSVTDGQPKAAFVVSRQIVGTNLAREIRDALEGYGLPVFNARTSQRVVYSESMLDGRTVLDIEPGGKAAEEVVAIANELLDLAHGKENSNA